MSEDKSIRVVAEAPLQVAKAKSEISPSEAMLISEHFLSEIHEWLSECLTEGELQLVRIGKNPSSSDKWMTWGHVYFPNTGMFDMRVAASLEGYFDYWFIGFERKSGTVEVAIGTRTVKLR